MVVTIKKGKSFPAIAKHEGDTVEIRAVVNWTEAADEPSGGTDWRVRTQFIDSQEDLDNLSVMCKSISVMFSDGTYVELPIEAFKDIFRIVPKGEMTDALYGNK